MLVIVCKKIFTKRHYFHASHEFLLLVSSQLPDLHKLLILLRKTLKIWTAKFGKLKSNWSKQYWYHLSNMIHQDIDFAVYFCYLVLPTTLMYSYLPSKIAFFKRVKLSVGCLEGLKSIYTAHQRNIIYRKPQNSLFRGNTCCHKFSCPARKQVNRFFCKSHRTL